jgi:hypothetical protein
MIRRILLVAAVLAVIRVDLAAIPGAAAASGIEHISGTYLPGSDVTEPHPTQSRFLVTLDGGLVVIGDQVAHYLHAWVREKLSAPLYIRIAYQDPLGGPPFENEEEFPVVADEFEFRAPHAVRGFKINSEYQITVNIYERKESTNPIDTLTQTVRAYVDTVGEHPVQFPGLRAARPQESMDDHVIDLKRKGGYVLSVPSDGFIADRAFILSSQLKGPSVLALQLSKVLSDAEDHPVQITVMGKSEGKTLQVIKDAFEIVGTRTLPSLDFTYLGSSQAAAKVRKWVTAVGATYHSGDILLY